MKMYLLAVVGILAAGLAIAIFAYDVTVFWVGWLIALGVLLGKLFSVPNPRLPIIICLTLITLIAGALIIRALPIHSLNWENAKSFRISELASQWEIEIRDPTEVAELKKFVQRGHYRTMLKSGYGHLVYVDDGVSSVPYYIHGNAIGNMPGGFIQTIFVPSGDFLMYFERLKQEHKSDAKRKEF
jgi:hypothetical protein